MSSIVVTDVAARPFLRTPGNDEELVAGFLLAEGFIESRTDLGEIRRLRGPKGALDPNAVDVILNVPAANLRERLKRNFTISSSCGVCGKTSIEATQRRIAPITSRMTVAAGAILELAPMMRRAQEVFAATGGLHAAALFVPSGTPALTNGARSNTSRRGGGRGNGPDATPVTAMELKALREDVGRHNAVDKVVGRLLLDSRVPASNMQLVVSGRAGYEIVQKAIGAFIPLLAAVGAPSSLAVAMAREFNQTLVGFLRGDRFNVYSAPERLTK